jgi:K+-sensing histidine kinase KdpD
MKMETMADPGQRYIMGSKNLPHIFDRFTVSRPEVDDNRSNGLGLSIAKGLMEAQGLNLNR